MKSISSLLKKIIKPCDVKLYGDYIAKVRPKLGTPKKNKKLILVTAISPTPAGEGKTTVTIGLLDALNRLNKKTIAALREPSMGPVFGVKGGANGGGQSQIVPKDNIDLHLTGDLHAITAANNLVSACIDNSIYWGNPLNIDLNKIVWRRVMDMNDRSLRNVEITIDKKKNLIYRSGFDITVASEIMAIFCLSNNVEELRRRIDNCIVAYTKKNSPVFIRDLGITNALVKILEDALWPNAVQSLEGNIALVHGGPFANIAHGCNSLFATKTALNYADYVVTEAGFGSDLGAEKFVDIVCDNGGLTPSAVVLVASIRALKLHGGGDIKNIQSASHEMLKIGCENLLGHMHNINNFGVPYLVCINKFNDDTDLDINYVKEFCAKHKVKCVCSTMFKDGSKGGVEVAKEVIALCNKKTQFKPVYSKLDTFEAKINAIVKKCYGAQKVEFSAEAKAKLKVVNKLNYWVCVAKTPLTFSDDPKEIVITKPITIHVRDLIVANGAQFIIVMCGDIFRMPGLPKIPSATKF